jgi:Domain of unknown function (DUF4116)
MKVGVKLMSDLRLRLSKIMELHGQKLSETVSQRELNDLSPSRGEGTKCEMSQREAQLPPKDLILRFARADPTDGKSRTQWLVKTYIADERFKLEDLGRVDAALAAFERFKRKLPVEQRELSQLKSLRGLEELVNPFVKAEAKARLERDLSSATGREKRRLEELKAWDESIIIQEKEGLPTIAVPMTEFASKWWGRGTKWCTSADKDNSFNDYHKNAPLIVLVCPDGAKFQMHVTNEIQFMDNTDEDVGEEIIEERWNEFKSLLDWALHQNGYALQFVPEEYRTPELCRLAVVQNGLALEFVPEEYRTYEICLLAIKQNGLAIQDVPEDQITPELYHLALEQNGWALGHVPREQRTYELCLLAVQRNGRALDSVPENHRTPELYRIAVEQDGEALESIPKNKKTPELCLLAVQSNGFALQNINERTPELCRIAVEQNGRALLFVPKEYRTEEICRLAVQQNKDTLRYVPEEYRTPELLAIIQPMQPKWHPDILQGLGHQSLETSVIQQDHK